MLGLKLGSGVQLNLELYRHRIPDPGNRAQLVQRDMKLIAIALDGIGNKNQDILVAISIDLDLVFRLSEISIQWIYHPVGPDKIVKRRPKWNIPSTVVRVAGRVSPTGISGWIGIDGSPGCDHEAIASISKGKDNLDTAILAGSCVARWTGSAIMASRRIHARRKWITATVVAGAAFVNVGTGDTIAREAGVTSASVTAWGVRARSIGVAIVTALRAFVDIRAGIPIASVAVFTRASVTALGVIAQSIGVASVGVVQALIHIFTACFACSRIPRRTVAADAPVGNVSARR